MKIEQVHQLLSKLCNFPINLVIHTFQSNSSIVQVSKYSFINKQNY